ncbi:hypothetical protein [Ignatzschineria sp. LJL83]
MNNPLKKTLLVAGSALFLAACQPNGPDVEALKKLRTADSGIEITNSRIKSVSPINDTLSIYDIEGMFKYRDGRYQYLTNFGDIQIYTPLNGEDSEPFNSTVIASEEKGNWNIVEENLPKFVGIWDNSQSVLTHTALFANSKEAMPGFYQQADGTLMALNDKALDKHVKNLIKQYERDLQKNVELDANFEILTKDLAGLASDIEKDTKKELSAEKLSGKELDARLQASLPAALEANASYQTIFAEKAHVEAEIKELHQSMPKLWAVTQCYDTSYRFYGRICNQLTKVNDKLLPEISYQNRPDADAKYLQQ